MFIPQTSLFVMFASDRFYLIPNTSTNWLLKLLSIFNSKFIYIYRL